MIVADYAPAATTPDGHRVPAVIASGKTALLVLEVTADTRDQLPASVSHQISASFGPAETGGGGGSRCCGPTPCRRPVET